jgi:hypothetical protein
MRLRTPDTKSHETANETPLRLRLQQGSSAHEPARRTLHNMSFVYDGPPNEPLEPPAPARSLSLEELAELRRRAAEPPRPPHPRGPVTPPVPQPADQPADQPTCAHCNNPFTPARASAKFCSNACRQAANRSRNATPSA